MKKKLSILTLLIALIFSFNISVNAKLDETYIADNNITLTEEKDSSVFIAGQDVVINTTIHGITFGAGNNVKVEGSGEYAFIAGNNVTFENYTAKDVWIAGNNLVFKDVNLERESYIAGNNVNLSGIFGRSTYIGASGVTINSDTEFKGGLTIEAGNITIKSGVVVEGTLKYPEDAEVVIEDGATINNVETFKSIEIDKEDVVGVTIWGYILGKIFGLTNIIIIGIVLMLLLPSLFKRIDKLNKTTGSVLKYMAVGLVSLICIPFVSIILMVTGFATILGVITIVAYTIMLYLSIIFAGYYLAKILVNKKVNNYLAVILGTLVLYLLKLIPFIGGIVSFMTLILGLGVMVYSIFYNKR